MKQLFFFKLQSNGNDFILFNCDELGDLDFSLLSKKLCQRQFSIGADGLIILDKIDDNSFEMKYFNNDGSEAEICGNALLSIGRYLYEKYSIQADVKIVTKAGERKILCGLTQKAFLAPINSSYREIIIGGDKGYFTKAIGNPHAVFFGRLPPNDKLLSIMERYACEACFLDGININFVHIIDQDNIEIKTWERGVGLTLSCVSGAASSFIIAHHLELIGDEITIHFENNSSKISIEDDMIVMHGKAELVYEGIINNQ
ncbi:MAG: diaminopimelate epimerase [Pseudomonadota bacterium]